MKRNADCRVPAFFFEVGAGKVVITSLCALLKRHPAIAMPVGRAVFDGARRLTSTTGAGKPQGVPKDASTFLAQHNARDMKELEQSIGRDLSGWKEGLKKDTER